MNRNLLWIIGQAIALVLGISIGIECSSFGIGIGCTYLIGVLVDIRREVTRP